MKMMNKDFADKCKAVGRSTFVKIGNMAAGNLSNDDKRGSTDPAPFSIFGTWPYEKPMPKRRSK